MENRAIDYLRRYLKTVIYNQAKSEGVGATFPETERILENQTVDGITPNDIEVIIKLKRAWHTIYDTLGDEIYFENICLVNAIVSDSTNQSPGSIRNIDVYVTLKDNKKYIPSMPNEYEIKERLYEIKAIDSPLERGLELFVYLTKAQMFENCNKRTALLMSNKILLENDLGVIFPNENQDRDYKRILTDYYQDEIKKIDLINYLIENCFHNYELDNIRLNRDEYDTPIDKKVVCNLLEEKQNAMKAKDEESELEM